MKSNAPEDGMQERTPLCAEDVSSRIWRFATVTSSQDVALRLERTGKLNIWDSVLAEAQNAGRGQLRRTWLSPRGNVYASLRLPLCPPFDEDCAACAVGVLFALALERMGVQVRIKWPNDLVVEEAEGAAKLGGILLEVRGDVLLAGIGLNLAHHPDPSFLRSEHALPATSLFAEHFPKIPPEILWRTLVRNVITVYKEEKCFSQHWRERIAPLLLWRGACVELEEHGRTLRGILKGVSQNGALLLLQADGLRACTGGSLRRISSEACSWRRLCRD